VKHVIDCLNYDESDCSSLEVSDDEVDEVSTGHAASKSRDKDYAPDDHGSDTEEESSCESSDETEATVTAADDGSSDDEPLATLIHKVEQTRNIVAVRWFDNRSVNLLSTFVGVEPIQQSRRWDKMTKQYIYIDRPEIVHEYNHFMGRIDLLDSLLAKYRYKMKSRRCNLYLFRHTLVIGLVIAWLVYRRDCSLLGMQI